MLSSQSIKTLEALYNEISKMKDNLSFKDISIEEKATKIASLRTENSNIEEQNSELNNKLNNSMQLLENLKEKNNKLIGQISTLKGQYDPDVMTNKELEMKLSKYERKQDEYECEIGDYKQQISEQQKIINACECEEKSIKIELLVAENVALENRLEELSDILDHGEPFSEDTTLRSSLLLQTDSISEEFDKEDNENENDDSFNSCKELKAKITNLESENKKLEISVYSYKTQVIDQQFIIDEYDCLSPSEEKLKENTEATAHENLSLRKLNLELQSQLAQFKEEATRLKLNNEKCKDELFAKKIELENITSKNAQYKKDSLIMHSPCNEKIHTLEYQLDGLREINLQLSNKFNQLKEKYEQIKCKQKQDYNEMIRLTNEFSEEQQMKIRDDDIMKINGMKSECAKLIFILKRIKKDHHRIRAMLKSSEKETALIKLENEKLDLENRRLKTDIEDITTDRAKVDNTNQQLKSTISEMKKANNAQAKDYKILSERLKKSESKLKVFIRPFL